MYLKEKFIKEHRDKNGKIFIKLTDDKLFKDTFGSFLNRRFLEDLLESYFDYAPGYLKDKLTVNYEASLDSLDYLNKAVRCDLIVKFDNYIINIEVYKTLNVSAYNKNIVYVVKILTNEIIIGSDYKKLNKVNQINLVENDQIGISEELWSEMDYGNKIHAEYFCLDKLNKNNYQGNARFIKYLKLFNANSYEERDKIAEGDEIMMELNAWVEDFCNGKDEIKYFNDVYWNEKIQREEGEKYKTAEFIREMLKNNISMDIIMKCAKMNKSQIDNLLQYYSPKES